MAKAAHETMQKVSLSLPRRLVEFADRTAAARGVSRSNAVAEILAGVAAVEEDEQAAEGYRFYADESESFAKSSLPAVSESLGRSS